MNKILIAFLCLALSVGAAVAGPAAPATATAAVPATPDFSGNPILASLKNMGSKFYYLGHQGGLDGWFIIKDGQVQIAYATPDNKNAIFGALFDEDGQNATVSQVNMLVESNAEVAAVINAAKAEQASITQVGVAPEATPAAGKVPALAVSPGERLMHELGVAAAVVIGKPMSPEIMMVMDPRCPHCQATWKALHNSVASGAVHLRMVPIGTQDSDNERAAAMLLVQTDPTTAWDKYVNGDKSALAGTPTPAALAAVRANHTIIDNWKIQSTPYLVYRDANGKVKVLEGEPEKISTLLTDLGQ